MEESGELKCRESKDQIDSAMEEYKRTKEVSYLGLVKNGKFIEGPNAVVKKSRAKSTAKGRRRQKVKPRLYFFNCLEFRLNFQ